MRNYDFISFCFNSEIHKKYWVSELCKITNIEYVQHVSLHEIDIQSQRLAENVLNRDSILLSNRMQSFQTSVTTNSSGRLLFSVKRYQFFHSKKLRCLR